MTSNQPDKLLREASSWLLRLNSEPNNVGLQNMHKAWLAQDTAHQRAWDRTQRGWSKIGLTKPMSAATPLDHTATKRTVAPAWYALAAAALLVVATPILLNDFIADYSATTADIMTVNLSDGSTVQLAPGSAMDTKVTADERRIKLLRGKAYFDVAKDSVRPFVVESGDSRVTVLGTAFAVQTDGRETSVSVERGAVGVQAKTGTATEKLSRGDRIAVNATTGQTVRTIVATEDIATWRSGKLFVADASIADVVAELRPYSPGWIVIADERLAAVRVTGLYDLKNPDGSLRALTSMAKGQLQKIGPVTILRGVENRP